MQPEFPDWWTDDDDDDSDVYCVQDLAETEDDGIPCGMMRTGVQCGNDAYLVVACHRPHYSPAFIAVCRMCSEEVNLIGEEVTAYWREKQRDWGMR